MAKQAAPAEGLEVGEEHRLLQGVVVVSGNALAEVTAIGVQTQLAAIAAKASSVEAESELVKGIDRISKFILWVTVITLVFVVVANILIDGGDTDIPQLLIFAIALAVSVIPEALPLVLTFALTRGALRFAEKDVIVKRLSSVQDLGSVNLLCTDKTGTITENRLVHMNDYLVPAARFHPLVLARLAAHDLHERIPEPFDRAADEALSPEMRAEVAAFELVEEEAFDPALRSNGAVVLRDDGLRLHIRRGSPEYFFEQGLVEREQVAAWLADEERQGHRVLGVSYAESGASGDATSERQREDGRPQFAGFVSFADKLKDTTDETVAEAKRLNVAITIITGDALMVAEAVGREAGLVTDSEEVVEASAFLALPVQEQHQTVGTHPRLRAHQAGAEAGS